MGKPRTSFLYSQGSSQTQEDGLVLRYPFFAVFDGTSAPFSPSSPPRLFGPEKLTGGEFLARRAEAFFQLVSADFPLADAVKELNEKTAYFWERLGLDLRSADQLPGLTLAIAKINKDVVEIAQAGDSYIIWATAEGKIHITPNQVRCHDSRVKDEIRKRMSQIALQMGVNPEKANKEEIEEIRKQMREELVPILSQVRRENINNSRSPTGYGLLNGQPQFNEMLFSAAIFQEKISFLILCTDGFLPWSLINREKEEKLAELIACSFQKEGLEGILRTTRRAEAERRNTSHIDLAEATAIALQF